MRRPIQVKSSEITDESTYLKRRSLLKFAALGPLSIPALAGTRQVVRHEGAQQGTAPGWLIEQLAAAKPGRFSSRETVTPYEYATQYNNFYEFGTDKGDPYKNAQGFRTDPWTVEIAGEAEVTGSFTLEDILAPHDLVERIYRLRCVEAWSMVVPWVGFPLADLIKRFRPTSRAKYVRFETLFDPGQMPGQRSTLSSIAYPYVEGLRIDEALFLGGKSKGPFLASFGADIFFDDQQVHCDSARQHVATGHVPHGVQNP